MERALERREPDPSGYSPARPVNARTTFIADLPPLACIVGAPRCGTTTFARWLKRRPEICFSNIKEPHFFTLVDLTNVPQRDLLAHIESRYLDRFFPHRRAATKLLAEGSVSYLYAPDQLRPMLEIWPNAKFIIGLRDPFELLPSVHQRLLFQGDEVVADFATAWHLQESRRQGKNTPPSCIDARQLQYLEVAQLGKHVGHFFEVLGRENCHIILFDDLRDNPTDAYRDMLRYLNLEDDGFRDFRTNRPSRSFRYGWLQRMLKRPNAITGKAFTSQAFRYRFAAGPSQPGSALLRFLREGRRTLLRWNEMPATKHEIPLSLQDDVRQLLRDDVRNLSKLIDRNLDHWLGGIGSITSIGRAGPGPKGHKGLLPPRRCVRRTAG